MSDILSLGSCAAMHPLACASKAYSELAKSNKFGDASGGIIAVIIVFVLISIALWIMSLIATYRLTDSGLQVALCFIFGSLYLFFAWIYYGFTSHKLVKMTKA
jgi:uncharacterized membrane protein YqjE